MINLFERLSLENISNYHISISWIMFIFWIIFPIIGFYLNKNNQTNTLRKISYFLILFCIVQEVLDYANRAFFDSNYIISLQKDLPFHFCHIAFYFSLFAIYLSLKSDRKNNSMSDLSIRTQFLFDASFLLGLSGALQGILTPDFTNIYNFVGILCAQLQHSLIILNVFWLIFSYNMRLQFNGVIYTYIFVNLIAPVAILLNYLLGSSSKQDFANYLYVMELPKVDNALLSFISDKPFPDFIFYIQPLIIIYMLILYIPFFIYKNYFVKN
tara:strand:- start:39 stop:848 length:810 start_codon:yes stop_codon:yes gene_type:complete